MYLENDSFHDYRNPHTDSTDTTNESDEEFEFADDGPPILERETTSYQTDPVDEDILNEMTNSDAIDILEEMKDIDSSFHFDTTHIG